MSRGTWRTTGRSRRWRSPSATGSVSAPPTGRSSSSTAPWSPSRTSKCCKREPEGGDPARAQEQDPHRKGRGGRETGTRPDEPSVHIHITARTDDGRRVTFRHDEIRDWYGNIRLDHGYALTIAAAQGLTVDRTFLLADDRPARETIYPAATRHREDDRRLRQPRPAGAGRRRPARGQRPRGASVDGRARSAPTWRSAGRGRCPRKRRSTTWAWAMREELGTSIAASGGVDLRGKKMRSAEETAAGRTAANDNFAASVSRETSSAPPSPGATVRRSTPSPPSGRRYWQAGTSLRERSAPKATRWRWATPTARPSTATRRC